MAKPRGWWTTHPTILNVTVPGCWDSNGDGIGDFEGIRQHLDYLLEMGISGLRFQQVTPFGDDFEWCGLVAQDWFDVDPHYGTMDDFDRLMADCREKDFAIMVMAVPEYLGWRHPDYLAAKIAHEEGSDDPRVEWFDWEDDGSVTLTWNRPAPDLGKSVYLDAYLKHLEFWLDKGISGWDADDLPSWRNLNVNAVRRITGTVTGRGGFITSEHGSLEHEFTRDGGFNAGTGPARNELYRELDAIVEEDADYIRRGLDRRQQLIDAGMFPFQQFGDGMYQRYTGQNQRYKLQMFRLQIAFNAALPDQVWALANSVAYPTRPLRELPDLRRVCWGQLDLPEIARQEHIPDSPFRFVKRMFSLRAKEKALGIGDISEIPTDKPKTVFASARTSEDGSERAVAVFNFSSEPVELTVSVGDHARSLRNYLSGVTTPVSGGEIHLQLGRYGFKLLRAVD